jgi:hypothetical protein
MIHWLFSMARKFDEAANFVSVQLTGQEPGVYDKCHPEYVKRGNINLA